MISLRQSTAFALLFAVLSLSCDDSTPETVIADDTTQPDLLAPTDTGLEPIPQAQVHIDIHGVASCEFVNQDQFENPSEFTIYWQRANDGPFSGKAEINVEPCELIGCWLTSTRNEEEITSNFSLVTAEIDWCHSIWKGPDFSVDVQPDMPEIQGAIRAMLRFGIPVPKGQLGKIGACRLVCGKTIHPAGCQPMVYWDPSTQEGIKWFRVLTALPTDILESNCTVEVLQEAPESGLEPLAVLDAEQSIQIKTPLLSATIPPTGQTHFLSNVGGNGSATVRLELRDTLGQEYTGKVSSVEVEENNSVTTIVRLEGHYESDQSSGNDTFNDFVVRLTFVRSALYIGVEHSIVFTSDQLQQRSIESMSLVFEQLGKLDYVDLAGDRVHLNPDNLAQSVFDGPEHATLTVDTQDFQLEQAPGSLAVTTDFGTVGVALRNPHQQYPKIMRFSPATKEVEAHMTIDLWPSNGNGLALFDTHPQTLKNELSELDHWFCVGQQAGPMSVGHTVSQPCFDWIAATPVQKQEFIDALAAKPNAPILLSDFGPSLSALDALIEECGPLCDQRWMIYDSRGTYSDTARGISKTHYLGITFKGKTRRLTPY